ncbi:MAG: hypothetical protein ACLRIS_02330 [Flavonifractor plautii]
MNRLIACTLALLVAAHTGLRQLGPYPSGRYGRFRPDGGRGLPCHCHRRAAHL